MHVWLYVPTHYTHIHKGSLFRGLRNLPDDVVYDLLCQVKLWEVPIKSLNCECKKMIALEKSVLQACGGGVLGEGSGRVSLFHKQGRYGEVPPSSCRVSRIPSVLHESSKVSVEQMVYLHHQQTILNATGWQESIHSHCPLVLLL